LFAVAIFKEMDFQMKSSWMGNDKLDSNPRVIFPAAVIWSDKRVLMLVNAGQGTLWFRHVDGKGKANN
jgi:hypothetical protein